ncbi:MAG: glycosyltransferase [Syntrophobacterales bacterium]|nr:glycosyltransferase [Syntrophobacterales bacterium]
MSRWETNLTCLSKVNPPLAARLAELPMGGGAELRPSRQGAPTLVVQGRHLHSAYDPEAEGRAWAAAQECPPEEPVVVFGLGLGYHILALLERGADLWVVEPSAPTARLALETLDLTPLLAGDRLRVEDDYGALPRPAQLLAHTPTRRLFPEKFQRLADYLAGRGPQVPGFLRVLVVGPLYGGSHPLARYCTRGFQRLGLAAEFLDFAPFYPAYGALKAAAPGARQPLISGLLRLLGEALLAKVRDWRPELVFFLAQAPVEGALLRTLKAEGVLTAYWFVEDYQVFPYWRDLAPEVDLFFTLQRGPFLTELARLGARAAFLPLAADPEIYRPLTLSPEEYQQYAASLSFVGAGYPNRREFFQGLLDFDFKIWGSDWENPGPLAPLIQNRGARVTDEEAARIFAASKINLNLHSSPFYSGINPEGDYLNPRVFDLAAAGAFQLVDWRTQLPEFFTPDREVAVFRSLAEARERISHFLAHPEAREEMAARARQRCLAEHTYETRLAQALELLDRHLPGRLPRRPRPPAAREVVRELFPPGHPVRDFAEQAPPGLTLAEVVARIQAGTEPLGEGETLLWLVHEFQEGLARGRF